MTASRFIKSNFKYIIIFTNIANEEHPEFTDRLRFNDDGTGYSGNWVIGKKREIEKVLLYVRKGKTNTIYSADYQYREQVSGSSNRSRVYFKNIVTEDIIEDNWVEFTGGQNPIRYIN